MGHYECKKCGQEYSYCECMPSEEEIEKVIEKAKVLSKKPLKFKFDKKDEEAFFVNYMIQTNRENDKDVKRIQNKAFKDYLKVAKKLSNDEIEIIKHAFKVKVIL